MSVLDDRDVNDLDGVGLRVEHRVEYSRSDIATTRRALTDLESQASRLGEQIQQQMSNASSATIDDFQRAWSNRSRLNEVNTQISSIRETMEAMMPNVSNARLSEEERTQIRGLYASRLYTQAEIGEQYGVSQPTIGDVVRRDRNESNEE